MAARSFWKGYLKLSLVTCPVAMQPATTESEKIRFHIMNRATGNRVQYRYLDSVTGKPVDEADQVKGYARGPNEYVILEDEELEAVALESTRTIDIETFAPADSIQWIWYDTPHYLTPSDPVGEEAYAVIREAMRSTRTVGIARLVLYRRERAVMLEPRGKGIVLWTLHYGEEVRKEEEYFKEIAEVKSNPELMELIGKAIEQRRKPWSPKMVRDPVQEKLKEIIKAKEQHSQAPPTSAKNEPKATPPNVVNIMDALRRSIAEDKPVKSRKK